MATRKPLVIATGEPQQLQQDEPLTPAATAVLGNIDISCKLPVNSTLLALDSLTVTNAGNFTVPNTCSAEVFNGRYSYWDTLAIMSRTFISSNTSSFVDITGLSFAALANAVYEIEVVLRIQSSDVNGMNFGVNNSGGISTGQMYAIAAGAMTTRNDGVNYFAGATFVQFSQNFCTVAATDQRFSILGIFMPGANAGNFTVQVKKITGGLATIFVGSIMKIRRLA